MLLHSGGNNQYEITFETDVLLNHRRQKTEWTNPESARKEKDEKTTVSQNLKEESGLKLGKPIYRNH